MTVEKLKGSPEFREAMLKASLDAIITIDIEGRVLEWNHSAEDIFGWAYSEAFGEYLHSLIIPEDIRESHIKGLQHFLETGEGPLLNKRIEVHALKKDNTKLLIELSILPFLHDNKRYFTSFLRDITERHKTEEYKTLMLHELGHRIKNNLSVVSSICNQSFRSSNSLEEARIAVERRILALSRAQDIIIGDNWDKSSILDITNAIISIHNDEKHTRFRINGPDCEINSHVALSLSLALNELATNAIKYGSLSTDGYVSIDWTINETKRELTWKWQEHDGPPVSLPKRIGFGSKLIQYGLNTKGATATINYLPSGVVCDMVLKF